jgi:hypothetical protein
MTTDAEFDFQFQGLTVHVFADLEFGYCPAESDVGIMSDYCDYVAATVRTAYVDGAEIAQWSAKELQAAIDKELEDPETELSRLLEACCLSTMEYSE